MSDAGDRTIPATPRRRETARREGLMPSAAPLAWAVAAVVTMLLMPTWAEATVPAATAWLRDALVAAAAAPRGPAAVASLPTIAIVLPTVGLVLAAAATGLAVRLLLDGWSWRPERALPDVARINPLTGFARLASVQTLMASGGGAAGLATVVAAAVVASGPLAATVATPDTLLDPQRTVLAAWRPLVAIAVAAACVAAARYAAARLRFERRIRMTPQEYADEAKDLQADPKIRLLHQQRSRQPAPAGSRG
jgi:flagellar biosynthesis protein FlhB